MESLDILMGITKTDIKLSQDLPRGKVATETFPDKLERVSKDELEACYIRDPIAFNSINLILKTFLGTGFEIVSKSSAVGNFIQQLRLNYDLEQLMLEIIRDVLIYGDAWVELLQSGNRITGLRIINAKSMDFDKTADGKIKLDAYGLPKQYFQEITGFITNKNLVTNDLGKQGIYIPIDRIAHFKLYSVSGSLHGIGLIEPVYNIIKTKLNVEKGHGQASYRLGYPLPVLYCGNDNHDPSPQHLTTMADSMKDLNAKSIVTLPFYDKLEISYPKGIDKISDPLIYYVSQIIAGMGVPASLASGSGENTNRSTLQMQIKVFKDTIRMIQEIIADAFRSEIFSRIKVKEKWNELPRIQWNQLSLEDLQAKADRYAIYSKHGIIPPEVLGKEIIKVEGLNKWKESA